MELRVKSLNVTMLAVIIPPILLVAVEFLHIKYSAIISLSIIMLALVPFFAAFERSKPRPRDMVPIAVMSALASLGRALFAAVPSFKPTSAIVIITGIYLGPRAGFLTGALSAFASNMFLGQGPWTPWQMYAWGMMGFVAGILQEKKVWNSRVALYLFGMCSGIFFGWFLNLQYIVSYVEEVTVSTVIVAYSSSLIMDITHGVSTVLFLFLLEKSWGKKLMRLKKKFGV